jgi:hypothetical protein
MVRSRACAGMQERRITDGRAPGALCHYLPLPDGHRQRGLHGTSETRAAPRLVPPQFSAGKPLGVIRRPPESITIRFSFSELMHEKP